MDSKPIQELILESRGEKKLSRPVRRVVSKERVVTPAKRGVVYLIKDRCKGCKLCIEYCPMGVLKQSEDFNDHGYHYPVLIEEPPQKICIACGFCTLICPDFAIYSEPLEETNQEKGNV